MPNESSKPKKACSQFTASEQLDSVQPLVRKEAVNQIEQAVREDSPVESPLRGETCFVCRCPRCKRNNQLPVRMLGKQTCCRHCNQEMEALDSQIRPQGELDPIQYWIEFTEAGTEAGKVAAWKQPTQLSPRPK